MNELTEIEVKNKEERLLEDFLIENTQALQELKKSTDKASDRTVDLTFIIGVIAFMQLLFMIVSSSTSVFEKVLYGIGVIALITFSIRDIKKDRDLEVTVSSRTP